MADDFLPYFNIYAAETLADEWFDVASFDERGLWFSLLLKNWVNGSIPEDPGEIARLLHANASAFRPLWDRISGRFIAHPDHPGRLTSRRLEEEREKAKKKVKGAKKAAKTRWGKKKTKPAPGMRTHSDGTAEAMPPAQPNAAQIIPAQDSQPPNPHGWPAGSSWEGDESLLSVRSALAAAFEKPKALGIGKDPSRVVGSFARWIQAVGEDETVAECIRLAREKRVEPDHLAWWAGWLDTVPDKKLAPKRAVGAAS